MRPLSFALGVDLGTSNTVAMLRWPDGRTRPLLFDGQPVMPSGVFLDQTGTPVVGRDARRLAQADPGRYEPNPKRRVDEPVVLLGDRETSPAELLGAILATVARTAVEAVGFLPPAVVTYPAAWGARRRDVLISAVARAGWPAGTLLLPEPVAAARYFAEVLRRPVPAGAALAIFDFGGGTLDIAVVRNEGPDPSGRARFAVLGSGGVADLGGLDLDEALVQHLGGVLNTFAPQAWEHLNRPGTPGQWRARRQFWDDVRGAKEMLSRVATAPVPVPGVDQALHLTREELERLTGPLLRRGVLEAARVITDSGVRREQLAGLFLVGGSSRVPLVARMLHADLGVAPTVLEQPELPVAEGSLTEIAAPPASGRAAPQPPAAASPGPDEQATAVLTGPAQTTAVLTPPASGMAAVPPQSPGPPAVPRPALATAAGPPQFPAPGGPPRSSATPAGWRRPRVWITAVVALVVLIATGGVALYLYNRGPRELAFTDVAEVARVGVGQKIPYETYTRVVGDRAYLAWEVDDTLELVAVDATSGDQRWRHTVSGRYDDWEGIWAYPDLLLVAAEVPSTSEARPLYALDPGNGREMWRRYIHGDDRIHVYDDVLVLVDQEGDKLVGVDPRTGAKKWVRDNPKNEYDATDATVYAALTIDDISGPADVAGRPVRPVVDDDYRLVQIGSDRKARVLDARSGDVLAERGNVGEYNGNYLAYAGRLYAAGTGGGYQIVAYDLATMGEPVSVYRAADEQRTLQELEPCGAGRLCVRDSGSAADSAEVAVIDGAKGGQVWRRGAPQAEDLVPVGDRVLIQFSGGEHRWTLRDDAGGELLSRQGHAVRVDDGNLLSFTGTFSTSPSDLSVAGVGAISGTATELGPLRQARGESCSWNTSVIVCMADKEFVLWRFAER